MQTRTVFKMMITLSSLLGCGMPYAAFFQERSQGWHWYQDPFFEVQAEDEPTDTQALSAQSPTAQIKAYQQVLEKSLHRALVYPTPHHVRAYQKLQKDFMERSSRFADMWMQVVYQNPSLDHSLRFPVNHKGRHLYLDAQKAKMKESIQALREDYGLFLFFDKDCPYCHAFAPIVKQFSSTYGWQVLAISPDGSPLEGFETLADNGLMQQWKVEVFPALFAINPKTQHVLPLAYGLSSVDQIEARIGVLIQEKQQGVDP